MAFELEVKSCAEAEQADDSGGQAKQGEQWEQRPEGEEAKGRLKPGWKRPSRSCRGV